MGLRLDIQSGVIDAYNNDLYDAVKSFTLEHKTSSTYDPATGINTSTTIDYLSRGVFANYEIEERVNSAIKNADTKLIVVQSELDLEPSIGDRIIEGTNEYHIINKVFDPADSIYEIQIRSGSIE